MQRLLLVGVGLTLMGCKGDTTAPTGVASGSLSFSYTGAGGAATYSASGSAPGIGGTSPGTVPWAAAHRDATTQSIVVSAAIPRTSSTWDIAAVNLERLTVGSNTFDSSCTAQCPFVGVSFGATLDAASYQFVCLLTSGTVAITSVSSTRVVGTFSGTGDCGDSTGVSSAFTVTSGSFDVPLVG